MRLTTILSMNCVRDRQKKCSWLTTSRLELRPAILALFAIAPILPAQELSDPVVLIVETTGVTIYRGNTSDYTKLATVPGPTMGILRTFQPDVNLGDIRTVNGHPDNGLCVHRDNVTEQSRAVPTPGLFIAHMDANRPS